VAQAPDGEGAPVSDAAPIGVFDSGVGGLSVLQVLRQAMPGEHFIYVADSGHAPYGERDDEFVARRAERMAAFFIENRAKAMVMACNTASVVAVARLRLNLPIPIVAMEPAIKPGVEHSKTGVVLVLATSSTVRSAAVERLCQRHGAGTRIVLQACPGLVEMVEQGELDSPATRQLLQQYLAPGLAAGADTVVLGCTHYAFLVPAIASLAGPSVTIIEPSSAVARQLQRVLGEAAPRATGQVAQTRYCTSGRPEQLQGFLALLGEPDALVQALPDAAAEPSPIESTPAAPSSPLRIAVEAAEAAHQQPTSATLNT
jgi:glutamate racemase